MLKIVIFFAYGDVVKTLVKEIHEPKINVYYTVCFLRGKASKFIANENDNWYRIALEADHWCYNVLEHLHLLLISQKQVDLLYHLLQHQLDGWSLSLYSSFIKPENIIGENLRPTDVYAKALVRVL